MDTSKETCSLQRPLRNSSGITRQHTTFCCSSSSKKCDHWGSLARLMHDCAGRDACSEQRAVVHFNVNRCQLRLTFKELLSIETGAALPTSRKCVRSASTGSAFFVLMHWTPLQRSLEESNSARTVQALGSAAGKTSREDREMINRACIETCGCMDTNHKISMQHVDIVPGRSPLRCGPDEHP